MPAITISEALGWRDILQKRYQELVNLRNENSRTVNRYIGANADKNEVTTPTYSVKALDKLITGIAREMRLLDAALKNTNATVKVKGYEQDDAVLGEIEQAA